MTTTFETAKIGDRVWCMRSGWGEIRETDYSARYPIYVCFPNEEFKTYTSGGLYDEGDITRSLFWDEVVIEAPTKPLPDLPVDAKVLVWDDSEQKFRRHFSHFRNGDFYAFYKGRTSFTADGECDVTVWPCWELVE